MKNRVKYRLTNRPLALLLALCLTLSLLPVNAFAATGAKDIDGHWAANAIETCHTYGIMNGDSNGTYAPNADITRAEFAALINRAFGYDALSVPILTGYTDVPTSKWYAGDMQTAIALGIIEGYGNGIAAPEDKITREQAAVALCKILRLTIISDTQTRFTDIADASDWAVGSILTMERHGYISGYNNQFSPTRDLTRAEAAQMLANVFGVIVDGELDAQGKTYQNVTLRKPGAILKNAVIKGDLFITEGVGDGDVWLDNVKISGRLLAAGGGENSIHVKDITVGDNVVVDKPSVAGEEPVRFRAIQSSDNTIVFEGAAREVILTEDIIIIIDSGGEQTVFNIFKSEGTKPSVEIRGGAEIEKITAFVPTDITGGGDVGMVEAHTDGVEISSDVNVKPENIEAEKGVEVKVGEETKTGEGIKDPTPKPSDPATPPTATPTPEPTPAPTPDPTPAPTTPPSTGGGNGGNTGGGTTYYSVTFNANGGTAVSGQSVASGGYVSAPTAPTKTGFTFGGWYKDAALTTLWSFGTNRVTSNTTLYAKWTATTPAVPAVTWSALTANGVSNLNDTTELTLTFDKDPTTLAASDITVTGAAKGALSGTGTTRTLAISNITVADSANVTVSISNPTGITISGSPKTVAVYRAPASHATVVASLTGSANPTAGVPTSVKFTVYDSTGAVDTAFAGGHVVTRSGISGTAADNAMNTSTVTVNFTNGVGTLSITLQRAAAQTVAFSVADVTAPDAGTVTITPTHAALDSLSITTEAVLPLRSGTSAVALTTNPVITLLDPYGNVCTSDSATEVTMINQTGVVHLAGTTTVTASNGVAAFDGLSIAVGIDADVQSVVFRYSGGGKTVDSTSAGFFSAPTYTTSINKSALDSASGTYGATHSGTVFTIQNTGNTAITDLVVAITNTTDFTLANGDSAISLAAGATTTVTITPKSTLTVNGGTAYTTNLTVTSAAHSSADSSKNGLSYTVNKKNVTITGLSAQNKTYDGNTTAATTGIAVVNGNIDSTNLTVTDGTATFADKNAGTSKAVTFNGYSLSGSAAGNYNLTAQPASVTANITVLQLTATYTAANKVYDGNTTATLTVTLTNAISGDTVSATATGAFISALVGTGKTVAVSYVALNGADAGNYIAPEASNGTGNITLATPSAPSAPTEASKTSTSVTLIAPTSGDTLHSQLAMEYGYNTTNTAPSGGWQDGLEFTGLTASTTYYFFARYKADANKNNVSAASASLAVVTTGATATPDGTAGNPFLVENEVDLRKVGTEAGTGWTLDAHYKQTESFSMTGGSFTAIGSDAAQFTGTYDGNNKTITGLIISASTDNQGMFGYIDGSGVVKDLGLENVSITSTGDNVGGVAGSNSATVKNCYVTGNITGQYVVGGVVGRNLNGTVQNCYVTGNGTVTGTGSGSGMGYVGGVAGSNTGSGKVENCYATVTVSGDDHSVGGVAGYNEGTVKNCYATGSVSVSGINKYNVGGVVGYNKGSGSKVENCYATGSGSGTGSVGGVVGNNYGGTVQNCVALNESVTATGNTTYIGRVAWLNSGGGTLTGNYAWDGLVPTSTGGGSWTPDIAPTGKDGGSINAAAAKNTTIWTNSTGFDFTGTWVWDAGGTYMPALKDIGTAQPWPGYLVDAPTGSPDGTVGNPFLVENEADLRKVGTEIGAGNWTLSAHYKQTENIPDMSGTAFTAIGNSTDKFTGNYDGGGFTITGLKIDTTSINQGMFGYIGAGGKVENLGLVNVEIKGENGIGGVAGKSTGMVQNCYVTGSVTGSASDVGGVVGGNFGGGTVKNCYATASVKGLTNVGGVVGFIESGTVQNCVALNQSVTATQNTTAIGRVAGQGSGTNNYAWHNITVKHSTNTDKDPLVTGLDAVDGETITSGNKDTALALLAGCPGTPPNISTLALPLNLSLAAVTVGIAEGGMVDVIGTEDGYTFMGETVTVTATPDEGWTFSHWEDENGAIVSYDGSYTFEVTGDVTLTAVCTEDAPTGPLEIEGTSADDPRKEPDPVEAPDDNDEEDTGPDGDGDTPDDDGTDGADGLTDGDGDGQMTPQQAIQTLNSLLNLCSAAHGM